MHRVRNTKLKKGYILVDTLIIGLIAMLIALFCYSLVLQELKYNTSFYGYIKTNVDVQNYKEILLTEVNDNINANVIDKSLNNIKNYLSCNLTTIYTTNNKASISYNTPKNCLILKSYFDESHHREDYFDIIIENGVIKYVYKSTNYESGAIV